MRTRFGKWDNRESDSWILNTASDRRLFNIIYRYATTINKIRVRYPPNWSPRYPHRLLLRNRQYYSGGTKLSVRTKYRVRPYRRQYLSKNKIIEKLCLDKIRRGNSAADS
jgi:hypothetical protein